MAHLSLHLAQRAGESAAPARRNQPADRERFDIHAIALKDCTYTPGCWRASHRFDTLRVVMSQLFFKGPLQAAIRAGTKRTTIRRWARPMLRAGQRAYSPGLGWLNIECVEAIELQQLNDGDAMVDGFKNVATMVRALESLYPDTAADGRQWFRVRFTLTEPAPLPRRKRVTDTHPRLF
jgi:hypothetical protein